MLISTAGAPGLRRQRAVNCCLWASETFSSERGALLAPAAVGSGDSASTRMGNLWAGVLPAQRDAARRGASDGARHLMACWLSEGWAAGKPRGENCLLCRGDPCLPAPLDGCCLGPRCNCSVGS